MPLARQKRVGGVSRLVATGRDWSQSVATGRDWSQSVATGHATGRGNSTSFCRFAPIGRNRLSDPLPKTRHKKSRMPESIQAFGCACRDA